MTALKFGRFGRNWADRITPVLGWRPAYYGDHKNGGLLQMITTWNPKRFRWLLGNVRLSASLDDLCVRTSANPGMAW